MEQLLASVFIFAVSLAPCRTDLQRQKYLRTRLWRVIIVALSNSAFLGHLSVHRGLHAQSSSHQDHSSSSSPPQRSPRSVPESAKTMYNHRFPTGPTPR